MGKIIAMANNRLVRKLYNSSYHALDRNENIDTWVKYTSIETRSTDWGWRIIGSSKM